MALIFLSVRMIKATIMIPEVCRHGHFPLYLDTLFNIAGHYMLFAIICCMLTCSKFSYKHHVSSVDVNPKKCRKKSTHNVHRMVSRPPRQKEGLQTYQPNFSSKCVIWIPNIVGEAQISQPLNQTVRVKMCGKNH